MGSGPPRIGPGSPEVEVHRDFVVGVDTGRHDDVDLGNLLRDRRDPRDVATQPDHGEVDERVDPVLLELAQLATARACSAASSHSSSVFSISGLSTKMCSCIRVRPRPLPSTGPRTVLTWAIASPRLLPLERAPAIVAGRDDCRRGRWAECHSRTTAGPASVSIRAWWDRGVPNRGRPTHVRPRPAQHTRREGAEPTSRVRALTRAAIIAASGATVAIGVVVAHDHPGAGATRPTARRTDRSRRRPRLRRRAAAARSGAPPIGELRQHRHHREHRQLVHGADGELPRSPTVTSGGTSS